MNQVTEVFINYSPAVMLGLTALFLINRAIPQLQDFINGGTSGVKPVTSIPGVTTTSRPADTKQPKSFEPTIINPVEDDFDLNKVEPYPFRPFKNKKYNMTMATRRLDPEEFFVLERTYLNRINLKKKILKERPQNHMICHESAVPALREIYDTTFGFLLKRFPMYFETIDDGKTFHNKITGDKFPMDNLKLSVDELLVNVALNTEEDFLFMLKNSDDPEFSHEYMLRGTVTCFPAGFDPVAKSNLPLTRIHEPVPHYKTKLQTSMNKFFTRLQPYEFIVRNNWSIQSHTKLSALSGNHGSKNDKEEDIIPLNVNELDFNKVFLRVEKQCFTRLPKTGAIFMLIRTYTTPLSKIRAEGRGNDLCGAIDGLDQELGVYKRRAYWGDAVKSYLKFETDGLTSKVSQDEFLFEN
ncbi:unnamed protein product [Ambrosiozyma monospora]|uniref:Unnamed protein product n=1 Tax=Ambrosiozyma monospora TaxID=43982 RepID=A0A9W7DES7_AMBMO|nr:unnamed protein product [Ambrosiozyma monospora]